MFSGLPIFTSSRRPARPGLRFLTFALPLLLTALVVVRPALTQELPTISLNSPSPTLEEEDEEAGPTGEEDDGAGSTGEEDDGAGSTGEEDDGAGSTGEEDGGAGPTGEEDDGAGPTGEGDEEAGSTDEEDDGAGPTGEGNDDGAGSTGSQDSVPTVSINSPSVTEGDSGAIDLTFTVTLSAASGQQVTVDWGSGTGGTATSGTDHTAISGGTLTFAAGTTSQDITVSVTGDTLDEADETVVVSLSNAANATIGTGTGTGTITDDDEPVSEDPDSEDPVSEDPEDSVSTDPTLSIDSLTVTEGDSGATDLTFTVTLSAASDREVTVDYAEGTGGTAAAGSDYTALTASSLTFAAGDTSKTITVSVTGDTMDEPDETVTVELSNAANATIGTGTGTGTIADNDATPTVTLSVTPGSISESAGTAEVSATLSHASAEPTTITILGEPSDFTVPEDASITIAAGSAANAADTVTITAIEDTGDDADRQVAVQGLATNSLGLVLVQGANLTITDAASAPAVSGAKDSDDTSLPTLTINSPSVTEGDSGSTDLTFTVTLSPAADKPVSVAYADTGAGTATSGTDYTALPAGTLSFAENETSKTITVSVTGDTTVESNETVKVALGKAEGAAVGTASTGTGTITDDDAVATLPALSINSPTVTEGDEGSTAMTFTVTLSPASDKTVTVEYTQGTGSTATAGTDFTAITTSTLTFAAGDTSKTFAVSVTGDTTDESDETIVVTLQKPENATITTATGTGTITDNDGTPTVSINSPTVNEGHTGSVNLIYTVSLSSRSGKAVTVDYAEGTGGSATAGTDYTALTGGTLTIAAGETSATITVSVTGDGLIETDETIPVVLSNAMNATIATGAGTGTGTITNDDGQPSVSIGSATITEGDSGAQALNFAVTLSQSSAAEVTVSYAIEDGSATSGADYTVLEDGTLTFSPAQTSQTITVSVLGDRLDESDETFTVKLSNPTNATMAAATGTGTITDNDDPPTISIASPGVNEGGAGATSTLTFTVSLSGASGREITVDYAEGSTGTATPATDYAALAAGTLTFAAGDTSKTLTVTVTGDATDEADETIPVVLSGAVNATIAAGTGTGTIFDDDPTPTVTLALSPASISENGGTATVSATLSGASGQPTTITIPARSLAYTVPEDASITIPAGSTENSSDTVTITAVDNTRDEVDRTVTVNGSAANSLGVGAVTGASLTLTDDDASPTGQCAVGDVRIDVTVSPATIRENGGTATVKVKTLDALTSGAQVLFSFSGGTLGSHFTLSGTGTTQAGRAWAMDFPSGSAANTEQSFTITARDNSDHQTRTLLMDASVLRPDWCEYGTLRVTIEDDDSALVIGAVSGAATEGGDASTFTVKLASRPSANVAIAVSGTDTGEGTVSPSGLTFTSSNWNTPQTVTITGVDDSWHDGDQTYAVRLGRPTTTDRGYARLGVRQVSVSTTDDESTPTVTLSASSDSISENGGTATVTATLSGPSAAATIITISPVSGAYSVGSDGAITIPAGRTSNAGDTVTVTAVDNTTDEVDRRVTIIAAAANPVGVGAVTSVDLTLNDDDGAPTVRLSLYPSTIPERHGYSEVSATLSEPFAHDIEVTVNSAHNVFRTGGTLITIPARSTTSSDREAIRTINNYANTADRVVTVTARASYDDGGTSRSVVVRGVALTITDDDEGSDPRTMNSRGFRESEADAGSGTTFAIEYEMWITFPADAPVTVDYAVRPDRSTATEGQDYRAGRDFSSVRRGAATVLGGTVTFNRGESRKRIVLEGLKDDVSEGVETVAVEFSNPVNTTLAQTIITSSIADGALPPLMSVLSPKVTEGDSGQVTLRYRLAMDIVAPNQPVTVDYADAGTGTATSGADYAAVTAGTLTMNSLVGYIDLTVEGDATDEIDETIVLTLSNPVNVVFPGGATTLDATGKIIDDDAMPALSISDPSVVEGHSGTATLTFAVTLSSASGNQVRVAWDDVGDGTATSAVDYQAVQSGQLTFEPGDTSKEIEITVNGDTIEESDETVKVRLRDPANASLRKATGTGTILDDEILPNLNISAGSVTEGDRGATDLTFTVNLTSPSSDEITVAYADAGTGTATSGTDYSAVSAGTLTFAANETSKTITVSVTGDTEDEPDETVTLEISNPTNATLGTATASGTITDDEDAPKVTLALSPKHISENGRSNVSTVTATLNRASAAATTITVSAAAGANAEAGDFALSANAELTIAAGATTSAGTVTVSAVDNVNDEPVKVVTVSGSATNTQGVTDPPAVTLRIRDDDGPPTLVIDSPSVTEGDDGATALTFTVGLSAASDRVVVVSYADAGGGSATAGTDYTAVTAGKLTFAAGETRKTVSVSVLGDETHEADETVELKLSGPRNALLATGAESGIGTITDDEDAPTVTLALAPTSIAESGATNASTVTATLDRVSSQDTTITVAAAAGTNADSGDFTLSGNKTLTVAAGSASSAGVVTITAVDNDTDEENKSVTVSGSATNAQGATDPSSVTLTITDDDAEPSLSINAPSVTEGDTGAANLTFTVTLSAASDKEVTVDYADAGSGDATSGTDYTALTAGTLTFTPGDTSRTITVSVTGDTTDEANETVAVTLSGAVNATIGTATGTGTITDDDAPPTVTLALSRTSITESGATNATMITASLDHASREVTTITVAATAGTNAEAGDFTLSGNKTLTIAAGATSSAGTVTITAVDNSADENDKSVTVSGSATNTRGVTNPSSVTLTITDDDAEPSLSIDSPSITEGDSGSTDLTFTVTLNPASGKEVTVDYADTARGAAMRVNDYAALPNGTLTFAAGETSKTITISVAGDTLDEPHETVFVMLSMPQRATVARATGTGTINDDDDAPTVTLALSPTSIMESGATNTSAVTATLNQASSQDTTITVAATAGTNAEAGDFTLSSNKTLTIAAGEITSAGTVRIVAVNNSQDELDKSITVSGSATNAQGITDPSSVTLTITDDDGAPTLSINSPSVTEGDSGSKNLTFTATLSTASGKQVTVNYADAGTGTATSGTDYTAITGGALTFAAGTTSQTFNVSVTGDVLDESNETVLVSLSAPTNAVVSTTAGTGTGTITDDDAAPTSITLKVDDDVVGEGDGATTIKVTATVDGTTRFAEAKTVRVSVAGSNTATAVDFAAVSAFDISIDPGATSGSKTFTLTPTDDSVDETDETITVRGTSSGLTVNPVTISLTDDDGAPTSITLTVNDNSVSEGDGATTITVTATVDGTTRFVDARTVQVSVAGSGTDTAVDFAAVSPFNIEIAAGAASGSETFTLTPTDDTVDETNETITVSGASGSLTVKSATISLTDDDGAPTSITLTVDDDAVGEGYGATPITVTATVDGATRFAEATTVRVSVAGSGTASAVDFAAVSAFDISIAAGAESGTKTFTLTPTDDTTDETDETVTVSGVSGSLTVNPDTIRLTDDDGAPTLSIDSPSVTEGNSGSATLTYKVTLDTASGKQVTVNYADAGTGTATSGTDYTAITGGALTFAAGTTSQTFNVSVTGDVLDESNETILVSLSAPTNAVVSTTAGTGTGTITDDDGAPTSITLTVDDNAVGEGDGATTITVTATVDGTTRFAEAKTVQVSVAGSGTDTAVDFAAVSAFNIEIAAGEASKTGSFTLTPTDDAADETDETITVSGASSGLTVNSATISLTDNDAAPTSITLTVNDNAVGEGDGATTITVKATVNGTTRFVDARTVRVSVAGSGTATAVDFAAVPAFDVKIDAGAASGSETFTLTPTNDVVDETNETVTVRGASGSLTVNPATITLTDDDAAPTSITLTVDDDGVGEGDGATTITVTAKVDGTTRFVDAKTVRVSVAGSGTDTAVDFAAVSAFDISIAAEAASGTKTFTLTPTDDAVDETDETVTVSGTSGSLTVNQATISLTDDDGAPTSITLTVDDNSVGEGDGATTITVKATVNGTTRFVEATTVRVSVAGTGTDTAVDFAAVDAFDIEIAAGAASESETFTLTPTDDVVDETDETITVRGASGSLTVNSTTISLTDNDAAPTSITLTVDDNSVGEGDGATTITVKATVDGATRFAEARTVRVSVAGSGTASAVDFGAVDAFDIEIPAGAASESETFTLTPTNDAVDETDETITVSGASGSLTVNPDTISLTDDDGAPTSITLTVDDNSVGEGDGATTITVTATVDGTTRFAEATTVRVSVAGSGTASAVDFAAVDAFDISIAAGAASGTKTFTLTPTDDRLDETDETITVSGVSGSLTVNPDTISLTDDDGAPTLSIDSPSVTEGNSGSATLTFKVSLDTASGKQVTVNYADAGTGTATSGTDYTAITGGALTFAAGTTSQTFNVSVTGDVLDESNETILVSLSAPTNAVVSTTAGTGTGTITDDDGAPTSITLTVNDNSVGEGDGATTITVTATVDGTTRFAEAKTVQVSVAGSGTAGAVDFAAVSAFNIEIAAGQASKTGSFTLTPTNDAVDETDETVTVSGTSPGLTVNPTTISLTDDDGAPTSITLTVNDNSVGEGDGATTITVTATVDGTSRFAEAKTVQVSVAGSGTDTAVDFAAVDAFNIEIDAGAASKTGTFTLTPTDDRLDETNETITVSGASSGLTVNPVTISLTDDDGAPTAITLTVNDNSVGEGDGATTITVTATVDGATRFAAAKTVRVSVAGSETATAVDFAAVSAFDIEIAAGAASESETFTLTPTDDLVDETNETVTVSGASGSLTVNPATITLTDDDAAPTSITLTVDDDGVGEGDGATTITVKATVDGTTRFAEATTVRVSVAGSGTDTAVDFAAVDAFDIEIPAGAESESETFTLTPTDDAVDETDETVTVSGASGSLTVNPDTISLTDDDGTPTSITLTVDDNSVGEGDGATTITVTATVNGTTRFVEATTVRVSVAGSGTDTAVDFAAVSSLDIEIPAGAASESETFTLTPTDDAVDETDETITVSGASGSLTVNSATISLTDNDDAPTSITLTVDDNSVGEGDGATLITVTATVDGTTRFAEAKTVSVSVAGSGTDTAVDFAAVSSFDIEIAAGAESKTGSFTLTPTNDAVDETNETITVSGASGSLTVNSATISLTDNDDAPTSITLTVNDNSVDEGDGATTITVTATVDGATRFAEATTVGVSVAGSDTATAVDFAAVSAFDIEIAAGAASKTGTFTLTPTDDAVDETNETITVSGASGSLTVNSATITLTDDDDAPTSITLTVNDNSVAEGDGATTITVTATVDGTTRFAEAKTVEVSVAGSDTATAVDFAAVSAFDIEIAAGAASKTGTFTLTPTNDAVDETNETITVSGASGSLTVNSATITLTDDDDAPTAITLTVNDDGVGEGDGATLITVTATVDGATRFAEAKTVTVSVAGSGTATAVDFAAVDAFDIEIDAGAASGSETFTLTPTDDAVDETDETITVSGASGSLTVNPDTISLTDDDGAPTSITLTVDDNSVGEGDGATTITVTATVNGATQFAEAKTVSVSVSVAGSDTASAVDFAAVSDFSIEIAAGAESESETFTLTPTDDAVDETDETITVSGASGSLTVNSATISLTDNDDAPTAITLTVNDNSVGEGDGATTITVTATVDGATRFAEAKTVGVSVAGAGTATAVDFAAVDAFDIEIAAGAENGSKTFTLTPTDDVVDETNETLTVSGASGSLTVNPATITLADNDAAPTAITLTVNDNSVGEGDGATTITVTATVDGATRFVEAKTVQVSVAGSGTATAVDFAAVSAFDIEIAAAAASKTGTFTLTPTNDAVDETNETITVSGASGSLTVNPATITLADDDGTPSLLIDSPSVTEGDSGSKNLTFTVALSPASAGQVTVDYADAGTGTATSGTDYVAITAGALTFPAGTTMREITVSVTGDTTEEPNETVMISLSNPANAVIGTGAGTGTGTITNDDDAKDPGTDEMPSLSIDSPSVAEGNGGSKNLTFTVTLSAASTKQVTVDYADAGTGTATSGTDYAAITGGSLTFPAETTSRELTVSVTGDTTDESNETVVVSLSNPANATIGTGTGTGTIANDDGDREPGADDDGPDTDDDAPPTLSIDATSVAEGDSGSKNLTFTVTLSAASTGQVTVDYADAGTGTATPGTDYTAITGGTLTFAAGTTSQTFNVSVTGDVLDEPDETVMVTLSNAGNATIDTATGTGAITDDDAPPSLSIDSPSVSEGDNGSMGLTYTVTLSAASGRTVTVDYADAGTGTATPGTDYAAIAAGTLTFPAGATSREIIVSVTGDVLDEMDETVVVALSRPSNATLGMGMALSRSSDATLGTAVGVGAIIDDDIDLTPSFGSATIPDQSWTQNWPIAVLTLPAATGGDGALTYALTPKLPNGLGFDRTTRELSGTPTMALVATEYSLTATDEDGDKATLSFEIEVTDPITLSIADAQAIEGEPVEFGITLSKPVPEAGTVLVVWRIADGTAQAHSDYALPGGRQGELTIGAGQSAAAIVVQTTDDDLAEGEETFTVRLVSASHAELGDAEATGRIIDDDLASLRGEALQWSLAAFGRTVATEAVDAIGQRFRPGGPPSATRAGGLNAPSRAGTGAAGLGGPSGAMRAGRLDAPARAGTAAAGLGGPSSAPHAGGLDTPARAGTGAAGLGGPSSAPHAGGLDTPARAGTAAAGLGGPSSAMRAGLLDTPARDGASEAGAGSGTAGAGWTTGESGAGSGTMGAGWTTGAWRNFSLGGHAGAGSPGGFSGPERSPRGEFLSTVAFETSLGATGDDDGEEGRQWTLWGRGSRSQFSGQSGARITLDGEVNTGYLGADVRLAEGGPLLGVALSYSDGELKYQAAEAGLNEGKVDVDLSSVLPYGHWALNERVSFWGLLGIGWGKASLTDEFGRVTTDTEMQMAALGSRGELVTWRGLALALKGDAFVVNMEGSEWARGDAVMLPEVDADANRLRLMVEGRREWQPSAQQQLGLSLEFGGRWDGGDADTGMGTELGGGLEYRHAAWGLGLETRGRYLLGHTERAFEEWGASVALALDPGEEGVGPSFTLAPAWGEASSGVENLWREERLLGASLGGKAAPAERGGMRPNRLRMELGYGFETRGLSLLKLYSALEEGGPGSRNWRLGGQVTGGWFNWSLELDRRESWGGPPEHGVFLRFGTGLK